MELTDEDGTHETVEARLEHLFTQADGLVSPRDNASVAPEGLTLSWARPESLWPGVTRWVWVLKQNGTQYASVWLKRDVPAEATGVAYNDDGTAELSTLTSGTYAWQTGLSDAEGNQAYSEYAFFRVP
jgi:hypothetical protein